MGLPNLTPEEEFLLKRFALLKKKKKALQKSKEKVEATAVTKLGTKRDIPAESVLGPEDAKEIARKLIASGEVKIKKDPIHRGFKRAKVGERRQKDFQQSSSTRTEQQSRAVAMKSLYDSFVPSSASQNRRFSGGTLEILLLAEDGRFQEVVTDLGNGSRGWSEEPRKGNTVFVNGIGLTEQILKESFNTFGKVLRINFEKEKSHGFVTFDSFEAAEKAIDEMNGLMVSGVFIKVTLAKRQPNIGDARSNPKSGWTSRDSRGHNAGLQSQEAREVVSYDDMF